MNPSDLSLLDFTSPWVLAILPFALLPLLERQNDNIGIPAVAWLPADTLGPALHKILLVLSVLSLAALVVALQG